ncbi:hypothetical protein D3C78_1432480 [compost metagenome]
MMSRPANNWIQDRSLKNKRSARLITHRVDDLMGCTSRVREIVFPFILVHPWTLEVPPVFITSKD